MQYLDFSILCLFLTAFLSPTYLKYLYLAKGEVERREAKNRQRQSSRNNHREHTKSTWSSNWKVFKLVKKHPKWWSKQLREIAEIIRSSILKAICDLLLAEYHFCSDLGLDPSPVNSMGVFPIDFNGLSIRLLNEWNSFLKFQTPFSKHHLQYIGVSDIPISFIAPNKQHSWKFVLLAYWNLSNDLIRSWILKSTSPSGQTPVVPGSSAYAPLMWLASFCNCSLSLPQQLLVNPQDAIRVLWFPLCDPCLCLTNWTSPLQRQ